MAFQVEIDFETEKSAYELMDEAKEKIANGEIDRLEFIGSVRSN